MSNWYQRETSAVIAELNSDAARGLSEAEAAGRLAEHGPNELTGGSVRSPWLILWDQFKALMVIILIAAALLSVLVGDYKDAIVIGAIVVLNAALGFSQEYRAEKAMAALKRLAVPSVRVRRDGEVKEIPASGLVTGDLVMLEAGNLVPADSRVMESASLQTHEGALTGESEPIGKSVDALPQADLPVGDRRNMVFMGTFITAGRGQAVVTETGMRTELGRIATMMQTVDPEPTPLQRRLDQLGKGLAAVALGLVAVIFVLGLLRGENLKLLFLTAVSIAVAAVPEGLPAVVVIALTLGAQRMLRRRVLIRKLSAVETLGSVTVICSDKTGTLTENRMTAAVLQLADKSLDLASGNGKVALDGNPSDVGLLLAGGALCNDAVIRSGGDDASSSSPLGDPTETALVVAAARFGLLKPALERVLPRVAEVPFSSERKRMTTVHRLPADTGSLPFAAAVPHGSSHVAFTKGAVDGLLSISSAVLLDGKTEPLHPALLEQLSNRQEALAGNGMRVLGVAIRWLGAVPGSPDEIERDLIFAGMVAIVDPARPEAAAAVAKCKAAGIRPVMISGDHPLTALHIARQVGIADDGRVVTGPELDRLSSADLERTAESVAVYARVSPEHKLKIVDALKKRGHIVAMTGDGVNDAPALKKADIGVAMGVTGTDVSKEAADMVLVDDNFASIVSAVEEGRAIFDNVRKFIKYILTTNSGEIWLMLAAPFLGMPLPLLPLQILWMNLVTDGLPALALGVEPAEHDTMSRPPYKPNESIFARGLGRHVIWVGLLMAFLSLGVGYWYWRAGDVRWQTMIFTTLTLSQMAHVLAIRSERQSLLRLGLLSNKPLLGAVVLTVGLQLALVYVPPLQTFFKTLPLPLGHLALAVALSSVIWVAVEMEKWIVRRPATR